MEADRQISCAEDNSVRIKVNNDCQWSCTFCHNEGTEVPENQPPSFKGPKVFSLLKGSPLPKEEVLEFCEKMREEFKK